MLQTASGSADAERGPLAPAHSSARRTPRRPSVLHLCVLLVLGAGAWAGARLLLLSHEATAHLHEATAHLHEATAHLRVAEASPPVVVRKLGGDLKQQAHQQPLQQQQVPASSTTLPPLLPPGSNDARVNGTPAAAVSAARVLPTRMGEAAAVSPSAAATAAAHVAGTARPAAQEDALVLARVDGRSHGTPEAAPSDAATPRPPSASDRSSSVQSEQQAGLTTNTAITTAGGQADTLLDSAAGAAAAAVVTPPSSLRTSAAPGRSDPSAAGALSPLLIPRLLHHNFLSGVEELRRAAASSKTHFRKEWWLSCQTHHPGWEVRFWDRAAAVELLDSRYPWFLPTWLNYSSLVLQSDALRPFILHAHGGVYLDLDTECFRNMEDSLRGHSLVLMAEEPGLLNNAQMASVPRLPLWVAGVAGRMAARAAEGVSDPLWATGPRVVTAAFRELVGREDGDLPGVYHLPSRSSSSSSRSNATHSSNSEPASGAGTGVTAQMDGGTAMVYGPRQWFSPCAWNDEHCHVAVSRATPLLRRGPQGLRRALSRWAAGPPSQLQHPGSGGVQASVQDSGSCPLHRTDPVMEGGAGDVPHGGASRGGGKAGGSVGGDRDGAGEGEVQRGGGEQEQGEKEEEEEEREREVRLLGSLDIVGMHHFSGSWLGYDGSKAERSKDAVSDGLVRFVTDPCLFVEVDVPTCCGLTHTGESRGMEGALATTSEATTTPDNGTAAATAATLGGGGGGGGGGGEGGEGSSRAASVGVAPNGAQGRGEAGTAGWSNRPTELNGTRPYLCPGVWGTAAHTAGDLQRQRQRQQHGTQRSSPAERSPSQQPSTRRCTAVVVVPSPACRTAASRRPRHKSTPSLVPLQQPQTPRLPAGPAFTLHPAGLPDSPSSRARRQEAMESAPDSAARADAGQEASSGGWRPLVDPDILRHVHGCVVQVLEVDSCRTGEDMGGRARGLQGASPDRSSPAAGRGMAVEEQKPQQLVVGGSAQLPEWYSQQGAGAAGGREAAGDKAQAEALEEETRGLLGPHGHGTAAAATRRVNRGHDEGKGVATGSLSYDGVDFDREGDAVDLLVLDCGDCGWRLASYLHSYGTTGYFQEHVTGQKHVDHRHNGTTSSMGPGARWIKKLLLTSDGAAVDLGRRMRGVRSLLLVGLPPLPYSRRSQLYDLYVQLYQVYGFVGYYHGGFGLEPGSDGAGRCCGADGGGSVGGGARGMDRAEPVLVESRSADASGDSKGSSEGIEGGSESARQRRRRLLGEPAAVASPQQRWAVGGSLTLGFVQSSHCRTANTS